VFRFNRRRSRSRGLVFYRLLELAVGHDPVRYRNIVAGKRPTVSHSVSANHEYGSRLTSMRPGLLT